MGFGVPEIIVTVVGLALGLVPFAIALWAVLTLREVQQSQNSIERQLEKTESQGLLERDWKRIRPTVRGRHFLNELMAAFLTDR